MQDYKSRNYKNQSKRRRWPLVLLVIILAGFGGLYYFVAEPQQTPKNLENPGKPEKPRTIVPLAIPEIENQALKTPEIPAKIPWHTINVKPGDTLIALFKRNQLNPADLYNILQLDIAKDKLSHLKPKDKIYVLRKNAHIMSLKYDINPLKTLLIQVNDNQYSAKIVSKKTKILHNNVVGTIQNSLFLDAKNAGLDSATIMKMVEIFSWDIDFSMDLRKGDSFSLVYEEIIYQGEVIDIGKILAAEFTNQKKIYRAYHYRNEYYNQKGRAMRKAFLRSPVQFSRISSHFNLRRKHPILNTLRAHRGVDYAAAHGTPIYATANGRIRFKGRKGGYGKVIIIQHGKTYKTLYAHMSKFARSIRLNKKIKQGQLIGYVGSTGRATGPHLHYEFLVNGHHKNPVTIKLPHAKSLSARQMKEFNQIVLNISQRMDEMNPQHYLLSHNH